MWPVSHIDLATPSWDVFLLLLFVLGALVYGLTLGRDRVIVIMVALYMGLAVVTNAPYLRSISASVAVNAFAVRISLFLGVFALLFFLLSKNALLRSIDVGHSGKLFQTALFSVLHVGLLVSVAFSFLPDAALAHFSQQTRDLFLSDPARFAWLVAPIGAMTVFGGKRA